MGNAKCIVINAYIVSDKCSNKLNIKKASIEVENNHKTYVRFKWIEMKSPRKYKYKGYNSTLL